MITTTDMFFSSNSCSSILFHCK